MPRINLLPWREALRQRRKKEFLAAILGAVLVGGLLAFGYKQVVQAQIRGQNERNTILRNEIAALDVQIADILRLEAQRDRLIARMEIIDQLQKARPEVVHLFDELVNAVPEGLYLTQVKQAGARIEVTGTAQSSTRVATLMRNIDDSAWLSEPGLDVIQTVEAGPARNAQFEIFAQQVPEEVPEPAGVAGVEAEQ